MYNNSKLNYELELACVDNGAFDNLSSNVINILENEIFNIAKTADIELSKSEFEQYMIDQIGQIYIFNEQLLIIILNHNDFFERVTNIIIEGQEHDLYLAIPCAIHEYLIEVAKESLDYLYYIGIELRNF